MADDKFYPLLSDIITFDKLPEKLGFLEDGLQTLTDGLFYSDYISERSPLGDSAYTHLNIVSFQRLALDIPGTGLALILNPGLTDTSITSIPISVEYSWPILRYSKINIAGFAANPLSFFNLVIEILGLNTDELLSKTIYALIDDPDPIGAFVSTYNDEYPGTPITLFDGLTDTEKIEYIIDCINENGQDCKQVVFLFFIENAASLDEAFGKISQIFSSWWGEIDFDQIKDMLIPKVAASIDEISLALEFPRSVFRPLFYDEANPDNASNNKLIGEVVDWDGNEYTESNPKPSESVLATYKSLLTFDVGALRFSTENGLEFEGEDSFSFQKSQIGNTGLTLYFKNMKLDLSRNTNIPEATSAGYSNDFVGVFVESAEIGLPESWFKKQTSTGTTLAIFGENLLLGTGGISGKFGLKTVDAISGNPIEDPAEGDEMTFRLGGDNGFLIGFKQFDVTLLQGEFIETNILGSLTIPGFKDANKINDAKIDISVSFDKDGDFKITAHEADGIPRTIPGVLSIIFKTLEVGKEDGKFYISTSGAIDFSEQPRISEVFEEPLEFEKLVIWEDGTIELKGFDGAPKLKKPITMQIGPAKLTVTAVHFGTDEKEYAGKMRKYWYFGFDGGISINPGGVDARGDGIKMYFTVDNNDTDRPLHVFFRIQSIAVDLVIPGGDKDKAAVLINGYLSMKDPASTTTEGIPKEVGPEYMGGVTFSFPRVKLSGSAGMRLNPSIPSFLIDISMELPKAIPLGTTGLGIYGFRGLFGQKYVASKSAAGVADNGSWYEYYKKKIAPDYKEGIQPSKFDIKNGFSVGAGMSLATNFDSGKAFSSKIFFMLSLPDVFLLEGQGAILKQRVGLETTNDPPFSAMISISNESVEAAFGVNLKIPEESGKIATVNGLIEMRFFFGNAGAWYINVGRDNPADKRVTARLLTLFDVYFYFMLSKQGISTGAGASWKFEKKLCKGVYVRAGAYLEVAGRVGFKPVQIGASVRFGGYAEVSIFSFSLGISLDASLAAEAPRPFIVSGSVSVKLKLPWPFRKLGGPYKIEFTWAFNHELDTSEIFLLDPEKVKAVNVMSGESFPIYIGVNVPDNINDYIIPVDSYIDVEFLKGMGIINPDILAKYGSIGQGMSYVENVAPQKGKSPQVTHYFYVTGINIKSLNAAGNDWDEYDVYDALTPINPVADLVPSDAGPLKYGYWQTEDPGKNNKLRILAQSELSYVGQAQDVIPEKMGFKDGFLFCEGKRKNKQCVTFTHAKDVFAEGAQVWHDGVLFRVKEAKGDIYELTNPFDLTYPFELIKLLSTKGTIEIFFTEPYAEVDLKLGSFAEQVRVTYYQLEFKGNLDYNQLPIYEYTEIIQKTISSLELPKEISYNYTDEGNNNKTVDKITIETLGINVEEEAFLLDEAGSSLLQENADMIVLEEGNIGQNETQLFGICMLNVTDYWFNKSIPGQDAINASGDARRKGFEKRLLPIWRPDTVYLIQIQTQDFLYGHREYTKSYSFIFKTAGPVGHFHKYKEGNDMVFRNDYQQLLDSDKEDQYKLASLKNYIDMARSYPNADGRLTNAKPLFYNNPKLLLFYKYSYVYTMFNDLSEYKGREIHSNLKVLIKDPTEPVSTVVDEPTPASYGDNSWKVDKSPKISAEIRIINNLAKNGMNCTGNREAILPLSAVQEITPHDTNLKPDKLYTAVFNAVFKGEGYTDEDITQVHTYVFKTSIYGSFSEQIQSCKEGDVVKAIFTVVKAIPATDINDAVILLNNTATEVEIAADTKIANYADRFERLVDGILKLGALPPAVSTEFNIIKDTSTETETITGILIRNPEPFNDPKIPNEELEETIQLSYNGGSTNDHKVILSKDKSMAFISNTALNLQPGSYTFTFMYKQFDGTEYARPKDDDGVEISDEVIEFEI